MCWTDPKQLCWGRQSIRKWSEWMRETGWGNEKDCEKSGNCLINPDILLNNEEVTTLNVKLLVKATTKQCLCSSWFRPKTGCSVYPQITIITVWLFIFRERRTIHIFLHQLLNRCKVSSFFFFWRALFTTGGDAWGGHDDVRAVTWPNRSQWDEGNSGSLQSLVGQAQLWTDTANELQKEGCAARLQTDEMW